MNFGMFKLNSQNSLNEGGDLKRIIFLVLVLTTLLIAQSKWQPQIEEINKAMIEAVMNNNPQATIEFYVEDAVSMPSYMPMMVGIDEMLKSIEKNDDEDVKWLSFDLTTKFVWESGDFVVEIGNYNYSMEIPMMPEPFNDVGKYMTVYEIQEDGSLKIKAETWNTDLNPWAAMEQPAPPQEEVSPPPPPKVE